MKKLLLLLLAVATPATQARRPAASTVGVVSAADPRAAAAGVEILQAGGSATDAAIATMLALGVVEPQSSGLGGGSFWVTQSTRGGLRTIDAREAAPAAANERWFYGQDGKPLSHADAVPGGRSVGVPGALRGMALAHRQGGKLAWARLFGPAIRLARDGWVASPRFVAGLAMYGAHVTPATRALYAGPGGGAPNAGDRLTNPAQAALLERLAQAGPDSFYAGPQAAKLVATVNGAARNPSRMTASDLARYAAKPRPPICVGYRGYRICGMGPPSSGGITVMMILKQLERFDLRGLGRNSPVAWHLFAQSSRLAYADRDLYVGDPDYIAVPVAGLLSPAYLASRSALISPDRSLATVAAGAPPGAPPRVRATPAEVPGTTDLAVTDGHGNVVEVTTTVEGVFGSGLSMDGIILNNQLTDFDIVPDRDGLLVVNRVAGGKRPRSSMAPTIVYNHDGSVRLAIGAAGGPTIIAQVAKALIGVLDWGMSAQDAIATGLIFAPGATAYAEQGTALDAMLPALRGLGETIVSVPLGLKANAVERVDSQWIGAADPRSEGVSMDTRGQVAAPPRAVQPANRPPE